jgi:membrane associated rhomboid family serine protease
LKALRNGRVLAFLAVWFGFNLLTGLGAIAIGTQVQSIAWQAHIGGFAAGLLLFSLFDPIPQARPRTEDEASIPTDDSEQA